MEYQFEPDTITYDGYFGFLSAVASTVQQLYPTRTERDPLSDFVALLEREVERVCAQSGVHALSDQAQSDVRKLRSEFVELVSHLPI